MKKLLLISYTFLFYITSRAQIIVTIAGGLGDGVAAINAPINNPRGLVVDDFGNIYIVEQSAQRIRKVNALTGIIITVAGNGKDGYGGDNGFAKDANLKNPRSVAIDRLGNLYIADGDNHRIRKVNASTGIITTIAGNGTQGFGGDGGAATLSYLSTPNDVAIDGSGNLYISDAGNHRIRKVDTNTGIITTVAGNGTSGYGGDGVDAIVTSLSYPSGVAVDLLGNLYIADKENYRIRKVNVSTGIISTIAGNGTKGYGGDGSSATAASLNRIVNVTLDSSGNLYINDGYNHRIRKVDANTGIITTVAGNGTVGYTGDGGSATAANLNYPNDMAVDGFGNIYIADAGNYRIRKVNISTGIITNIAGNGTSNYGGDDGSSIAANLYNPYDVTIDRSKNLYIADYANHRIRKVNAITGIITTLAGNGIQGFGGDGGNALAASLNEPSGLSIDSLGNLYIADKGNHRIRKVNTNTGIISTVAGGGSAGDGGFATVANLYTPIGVTVDGLGNLYIADAGHNKIRKVNVSTGIISTIAGNGEGSYGGDGGAATNAKINYPTAVAVDGSGNLYIADYANNRVRKVDASTVIISTIAGNSLRGYTGDGVLANIASLNYSSDIAVDKSGNLYIADYGNSRIRKVNASTGIISTIAGNGIENCGGDGGAATAANLYKPSGIVLDSFGNLYIADNWNNRIRKVMDGIFNNVISGNQTVCFGKTPDSLIANTPLGGNGIYTYTWLKSTTSATAGFSAIDTSNTNNYKPTVLTQNTWYRRYVISGTYTDTSAAVLITINPSPLVGFKINNAEQCIENNFLFTDTSSVTFGTLSRKWNLGAGINDTSTLSTISKRYLIANTYNAKLVITSNNGCKDSITKAITVNPNPSAGFTINNPTQCLAGNKFLITDTSTISTGTIARKWNLGAGNNDTSSIVTVNKVYASANNYNVKLVSISDKNCQDSIIKTIVVFAQPKAGFTINKDSQCLNNNSFVFTDTTTNNSSIWSTGIGNNQTTKIANQTYSNIGNYNVKLVVKSVNNCVDSISKSISVIAEPTVGVILGQTVGVVTATPYVYNVSQQLNHIYNWSITNGTILSGQGTNSVSIQWRSAGVGKIKVEIKNTQSCIDTTSLNVSINTLGLNEVKNKLNFQVFPNPNNGSFIIRTNDAKANNAIITVENMLGQEIWSTNQYISSGLQEIPININLKAGMYLLRFQNEDGQAIKSIVVE